MVVYPRRLLSSYSPLREPELSRHTNTFINTFHHRNELCRLETCSTSHVCLWSVTYLVNPLLSSFDSLLSKPSNVVVERLTFLLRIQEVRGSSLGSGTGYPDWNFSWLFSVPPGESRDIILKLGHDRFLPNPLNFIIHFHHFIRCYVLRYWKRVVK
jgi:hypothetical protein